MGLSWPLLARAVGLAMQMAGTVLAVQAMPVEQVAIYFAVVAAANLISTLSDFGFCQYAFRYINRGVALPRVFAAALSITIGGCVPCLVLGMATAAILHLPPLILLAAIGGSALYKLILLNSFVQLIRSRATLGVLITGLQSIVFVLLLLAYAVLVPGARSGRGTLGVVGAIYPASFALAFPASVLMGRQTGEWCEGLRRLRPPRRRDIGPAVRAVRRSILLAVEWNLTTLWMSFLVLWFKAAGDSYETAVLGVLQRLMGVPRAAVGVSLYARMTYYYNAVVSSAYLLKLARQGLIFGCGIAIVAFAGGWVIEIGRALLARVQITQMLAELARYWILLGVVCMLDYVFFHLSWFALGLNRKLIRVVAPAAGLAVLLAALPGADWILPHDRIGYGLAAYATSLSIADALLLIFLIRLQARAPIPSVQPSPGALRTMHRIRADDPD
jgi:hypothetical protein